MSKALVKAELFYRKLRQPWLWKLDSKSLSLGAVKPSLKTECETCRGIKSELLIFYCEISKHRTMTSMHKLLLVGLLPIALARHWLD